MGLLMHSEGSSLVPESEVRAVRAPKPEGRWYPIPHSAMIDNVRDAIKGAGLQIREAVFGLTAAGKRFFGTFDVKGKGTDQDTHGLLIGMRNSIDKSMAAGICFGSHVFVCDNLCFSGEITVLKKHTKGILAALPKACHAAVQRFPEFMENQNRLYDTLKGITPSGLPVGDHVVFKSTKTFTEASSEIRDEMVRSVDHVILSAVRRDIIPSSKAMTVWYGWENPELEAFEPRTAWSLFNAFTAAMKQYQSDNPAEASQRTIRLTGMFTALYMNG